jgi:hypothetical protein
MTTRSPSLERPVLERHWFRKASIARRRHVAPELELFVPRSVAVNPPRPHGDLVESSSKCGGCSPEPFRGQA